MPDLIEQLRRYGEAVERRAADREAASTGRRHRPQRHRARAWAVAACLLIVVSAVVFAATRGDETAVRVTTDDSDMVFSEATDSVLLFSDGIDGVLAIDLDRRIAGRRAIEGERAGDQPFRLTVAGDSLIVGWDEIYALPISGGSSTLIDKATIYIPAAEAGQVWTLDYAGGRTGPGPTTLQRVDIAGSVLFRTEAFDPSRYEPLTGVPGGLAVATADGIAIWNAETATIGRLYRSEGPFRASSSGRQLAWCGDPCDDVRLVDLSKVGDPTPQHVNAYSAPVFSPDGRYVALLVAGGTLTVMDTETATTVSVAGGLDLYGEIQWAPSGGQLFYATRSYGEDTVELGRYDLEAKSLEKERVPVGGGLGFVVLDRADASGFLAGDLGRAEACLAPELPSGRTSRCRFRF